MGIGGLFEFEHFFLELLGQFVIRAQMAINVVATNCTNCVFILASHVSTVAISTSLLLRVGRLIGNGLHRVGHMGLLLDELRLVAVLLDGLRLVAGLCLMRGVLLLGRYSKAVGMRL